MPSHQVVRRVVHASIGRDRAGWLSTSSLWGLVHQLGYHLPALRRARRPAVLLGALAALSCAGALAWLGPFSRSLVTVGTDTQLSNLAPPWAQES